jgi:hypothetical protein
LAFAIDPQDAAAVDPVSGLGTLFQAWLAAHGPTLVRETGTATATAAPRLEQNRPNPCNGMTIIPFLVAAGGSVDLAVYDLAGQRLATLFHGSPAAGLQVVAWDGRDARGRDLASGPYLYRLRTDLGSAQRALLLVR